MRRQTNFDMYLKEQMKDPEFKERFEKAGEAWDVALQRIDGEGDQETHSHFED